jgi:NAD(P)-dependent dehydrogenase (short-subunit alcohol dehydrogenase family)
MKLEDNRLLFNINLFSAVECARYVLKNHFNRPSEDPFKIVTVSSMASKFETSFRSSYGSTKAGMNGFFNCLRCELASNNILVINIYPGYINTKSA